MATPLTKAQKFAFYFLVSTNSQVRFALEGRSGDTYGSAGGGPAADAPGLKARIARQLKLVFGDQTLDDSSINNASMLFDNGSVQKNNVTLDQAKIRAAVGMDDFYDPGGDPCPSDYTNKSGTLIRTNEQSNIVSAILGPVHLEAAAVIPPLVK
jgi:hypothetical protein